MWKLLVINLALVYLAFKCITLHLVSGGFIWLLIGRLTPTTTETIPLPSPTHTPGGNILGIGKHNFDCFESIDC